MKTKLIHGILHRVKDMCVKPRKKYAAGIRLETEHSDAGRKERKSQLTLYLLTWRIWWAPNNASKWQMGFNSAFKGL